MTPHESDALYKFAAEKLGVKIVWQEGLTENGIEMMWQVKRNIPHPDGGHIPLLEDFNPLTSGDLMLQGMSVLEEEGYVHAIHTWMVLIWPANEPNDETRAEIEDVRKTPTAFWQCWMTLEGMKEG